MMTPIALFPIPNIDQSLVAARLCVRDENHHNSNSLVFYVRECVRHVNFIDGKTEHGS